MVTARLTPESTACLLIDVQDLILPDMHEQERLVDACTFLAQVARTLSLPTLVTEQVKRVFGPTAPAIKQALPSETPVIEKSQFSGCVDPVTQWLERTGRKNLIVAGIEAHICILQTSLDLLQRGIQVFLVSDAISAGEPDQIEVAIRRIEQAGGITTGCVSLTYELLSDARHPAFKTCLEFVKRIRPPHQSAIGGHGRGRM